MHANRLTRHTTEIQPPREQEQQEKGFKIRSLLEDNYDKQRPMWAPAPRLCDWGSRGIREEESPVGDPPVAGNMPPHTQRAGG
jgi:hypothetical protein